jgi:Na+-driven multidrug efflux pump
VKYLYSNGIAEVVTLVASIIPLVALFQVFDATSAVTNGVLRARGRQVRILIGEVHVLCVYVSLNLVHWRVVKSFVRPIFLTVLCHD